MTTFQTIILVLTGVSSLTWLVQLFTVWYTGKTMPRLEDMQAPPLENPPKVSVIIPACNEEDTLEASMQLRLQDTYPNLEFILIDDRSEDNTRDIVRRIAARDQRVKPVYIDKLPEGWLGKVHALHTGVKHSGGDWLLFSDADVHVHPDTCNRIISFCEKKNLDHVAVLPELYRGNILVDTAVSVFIKALIVIGRTWNIKKKKARAYTGSGSYNLVRRSAYEQTEGFEWLKMEVVDDLCLGMMVKRSGFNSEMVNGLDFVGVHWYRNLKDMKTGMSRALFSGIGNFSMIQALSLGTIGFIFDMLPYYAALVPMGIPFLPYAGFALILLSLLASVKAARLTNIGTLPALLQPLGNIMVFALTIRAGIIGAVRGGIYWRGTFYSKKELRQGRRFTY
jgi:glycosyltransferase involved in cell wall biosynthesis